MRLAYDLVMIATSALAAAATLPHSLSWAWVMLATAVLLQGGASSWNAVDKWHNDRKHGNLQILMGRRQEQRVVQVDELQKSIDRIDTHVCALDVKMDTKFGKLEERFDKLEARFDKLEARFDKLDARFDTMENKFDQLFKHLMIDPPPDVTTKADVQEAIQCSLINDHGFTGVGLNQTPPWSTLEEQLVSRSTADASFRRRLTFTPNE